MSYEISLDTATDGRIQASQMKVGDMGYSTWRGYEDHLILRVFGDRWISLTDPETTWSPTCQHIVKLLKPGQRVILEVTE